MAAYLINCECGNTLPVEVGQAGGQITCRCGAKLDVPPLRQLRQLPQVQVAEAAASRSWSTRQGVVAASLIIAATLVGWSAWSWWHDAVIPKFDPSARMHAVDEQIKTPVGAWDAWIGFYKPLAEHGLRPFQLANAGAIEQYNASRQFMRWMLLSIAGIFALTALATAFWPKPTSLAAPRREAPRP